MDGDSCTGSCESLCAVRAEVLQRSGATNLTFLQLPQGLGVARLSEQAKQEDYKISMVTMTTQGGDKHCSHAADRGHYCRKRDMSKSGTVWWLGRYLLNQHTCMLWAFQQPQMHTMRDEAKAESDTKFLKISINHLPRPLPPNQLNSFTYYTTNHLLS